MPVSEYSENTDRTTDVQTQDQTPFSTIINSHPEILKGLTNCAFIYASPIQVAALPTIIAGNGKIVQYILYSNYICSHIYFCNIYRHNS